MAKEKKAADPKELSVEDKLKALYKLQTINSTIDEIKLLRLEWTDVGIEVQLLSYPKEDAPVIGVRRGGDRPEKNAVALLEHCQILLGHGKARPLPAAQADFHKHALKLCSGGPQHHKSAL